MQETTHNFTLKNVYLRLLIHNLRGPRLTGLNFWAYFFVIELKFKSFSLLYVKCDHIVSLQNLKGATLSRQPTHHNH